MKCTEAPEETPTISQERFLQLSCFINQGKLSLKYLFSSKSSFSRCEISVNGLKKRMLIKIKCLKKYVLLCLEIGRKYYQTFISTWS
jgi:hypothetical protein